MIDCLFASPVMRNWKRRRNWARAIGVALALGGALSYVPGIESSFEFHAFGLNMSFLFCLLGWGVGQGDHISRRLVLALLHAPVLLMGYFGYEAVYQLVIPDYEVAAKTLATSGEWANWLGMMALVFLSSYVPCFLLSDRKVKLLFEPSRMKRGLPKRARETVKAGKARWTVPILGGASLAMGIVLAATEEVERVAFFEVEELRKEHAERIDYMMRYTMDCSRMGGYYAKPDIVEIDGVKVSRMEVLFGGIDANVWMEPAAREGQNRGFSTFGVWPVVGGAQVSYDRVTSLPLGYRFDYPVVYRGRALLANAGEPVDVTIYRDWVASPGSNFPLQLVIVVRDD